MGFTPCHSPSDTYSYIPFLPPATLPNYQAKANSFGMGNSHFGVPDLEVHAPYHKSDN